LSIWRLAAVGQALQRGKGDSDEQEATCVKRTAASCLLPKGVEYDILYLQPNRKGTTELGLW